jgi:formylglycine-generating enzyme required for sulfatase activity
MSRIFLSHSSADNAEAVALRDWLNREGWDDIFLDVDPDRGIAAGERWERALSEAANRCEAVLFVVSRAWLASDWCVKEFNLAYRLNKKLFGVLVEDLPIADLPVYLTSTWQLVRLCAGRDHVMLRVTMPFTGEEAHVSFSSEALARLKTGLQRAGLDPRFFAWPPESDPNRPPYRGLRPLEAEDAGIFFGRDAPIVEALDRLRGLRDAAPPRLLVILGASGAGKSSFLRAGLVPRIQRDDQNFMVLPVLRPERAAISGEAGLVRALESAMQAQDLMPTRAEIRTAIEGGAPALLLLLSKLVDGARPPCLAGEPERKSPTLVLPIDQGEELFLAEGAAEAEPLLALMPDLLTAAVPGIIVIFTIRSDSYERLQSARVLEGISPQTLSLPPLPQGAYQAVIEGPAERLKESPRALKIAPALTQALLADIEAGGGPDALPLLAFTLERLYVEFGGRSQLTLRDYEALGRIKGSIEAAVEQAMAAADADPSIPRDRAARLALLRRGFIPWLASIDPETGNPRRRVARIPEIPAESRPLIDKLVAQHLLATDVAHDTGEVTIEPAHEALLRQWGLLQGWLAEDAGLLAVLDGVKRASRDWAANNGDTAWLTHTADRLAATEPLLRRPDLSANLEPTDRDYLTACHNAEAMTRSRKRRGQALVYGLLLGIIGGLLGWINQAYLKEQIYWYATVRPYMMREFRPHVLTADAEQALRPKEVFRECAKDCPEMVVLPAGSFKMGSSKLENAMPQHEVTIGARFAVAKFELTFAEWDACSSVGACPYAADTGWGRDNKPVINVSLNDAEQYVEWLSLMTGRPYRLLSEAEYEYAARAGTQTGYYWGDQIGSNNAHCAECASAFDGGRTTLVGKFAPNAFGLYDMGGNVWEWVADCYHDNYDGAPTDGSAWMTVASECQNGDVARAKPRTGPSQDGSRHVIRGGGFAGPARTVRSDFRHDGTATDRWNDRGFRVARPLTHNDLH